MAQPPAQYLHMKGCKLREKCYVGTAGESDNVKVDVSRIRVANDDRFREIIDLSVSRSLRTSTAYQ
jgi:hypothetical protein